MNPSEALRKAIEVAGSQGRLAEKIGCSQPSVFLMKSKGRASLPYVLKIEQATGVSRHDLAPEYYPRESAA